jgi:hypothetical protein
MFAAAFGRMRSVPSIIFNRACCNAFTENISCDRWIPGFFGYLVNSSIYTFLRCPGDVIIRVLKQT